MFTESKGLAPVDSAAGTVTRSCGVRTREQVCVAKEQVCATAGPPVEEIPQVIPPGSDELRHASPALAKEIGSRTWAKATGATLTAGQQSWMQKLKAGDFSGVETPPSSFVDLRGTKQKVNPRTTAEYRQGCVDI